MSRVTTKRRGWRRYSGIAKDRRLLYNSHMRLSVQKTNEIDPGRDAAFYVAHRDELLARYGGRMIAIRDEEVVADAETYFELNKLLCARYGGLAYAYIKKVTPQSFEDWGDEPAYIVV